MISEQTDDDPDLLAPEVAEKTIDAKIFDGLDRGALVMLKILEDETRTPDTNALVVDFKQRAEAFKMLTAYMEKRAKAVEKGAGSSDGMPPYEQIRKWLDEMGYQIVPKKRGRGRPSAEQLAQDAEVLGEDMDVLRDTSPPSPPEPAPPDAALAARLAELAKKPLQSAVGPTNG